MLGLIRNLDIPGIVGIPCISNRCENNLTSPRRSLKILADAWLGLPAVKPPSTGMHACGTEEPPYRQADAAGRWGPEAQRSIGASNLRVRIQKVWIVRVVTPV